MSEPQPSLSPNREDNSENNKGNSLLGKSGGNNISEESSSLITKTDLLSQLDPTLRDQLSSHTWEIINYNPLKLYIAHREHKQIILASIKSNKIRKQDDYYNLSLYIRN